VKLRQVGGQADVREPRRNAGAERSNRPTGLFDRVSQDVSDFVLHTASVTLSTSLQPRLDLLFQVTNNELRHQVFPHNPKVVGENLTPRYQFARK